uniref:Pheromone-processing carboxypeptidase KEX1 n=1 Tax=Candidozyma auris TaxID=498019 RepID=A0A0L0P529_CANAR
MLWLFFLLAAAWANPIKLAREELSQKRGSSVEDYLVTSLPGLFKIDTKDIPVMFAGQLRLYEQNDTHYFFWKFQDQHKAPVAEKKLIFWLNGGPGCSSMDGALMEAGPLRVNKHKEVVYNEGSWHKRADIVFVDQPAGTGFSYSDDYANNLNDVSWHFKTFLEKYFDLFPEERHYDIMLAGESFAGQYIPYIAHGIIEHMPDIHLAGLLIGNGYIDPYTQGLSYLPFAQQAGIISTNHPNWRDLLSRQEECQKRVDHAKAEKTPAAADLATRVCDNVLSLLLQYTRDNRAAKNEQCFNMYDYKLKDSFPSCGMHWPPDLQYVTPFLRDNNVMNSLNLENKISWKECRGNVGTHLNQRDFPPAISLLPDLLKNTKIVLFHGDRDIICNYVGAEYLVRDLDWNGKKGFSESLPTYDWIHEGEKGGYLQSEANLTYVNVFEASHMVPFDKPELSSALVDILYERYDVVDNLNEKPKLITHALSYSEDNGRPTKPEPGDSQTSSLGSSVPVGGNNSTSTTDGSEVHYGSAFVRLIQFAVIIVLIWGVCALFSAYRSRPASIIKTKSSNRKKNVQWADQLEEEELGIGPNIDSKGSIFSRAFLKLTGGDPRGRYAPTLQFEDIELESRRHDDDADFIIASDDEAESPPEEEEPESGDPALHRNSEE